MLLCLPAASCHGKVHTCKHLLPFRSDSVSTKHSALATGTTNTILHSEGSIQGNNQTSRQTQAGISHSAQGGPDQQHPGTNTMSNPADSGIRRQLRKQPDTVAITHLSLKPALPMEPTCEPHQCISYRSETCTPVCTNTSAHDHKGRADTHLDTHPGHGSIQPLRCACKTVHVYVFTSAIISRCEFAWSNNIRACGLRPAPAS